jgi:hypothetical protein
MNSPQRLAAALIGAALLITAAGCQSSTPDPQGSTVTTRNAEMPPLPEDPDAAEAAVRKILMDEAVVLLKASGLKYTAAQFDVPTAFDDDNAQSGDLSIQFRPCSDLQTQAMTAAIWAHGWEQGSISHGVNVRKGPLYLQWGNTIDGCPLEITTVNIYHYLPGIKDITQVLELAAFKATG